MLYEVITIPFAVAARARDTAVAQAAWPSSPVLAFLILAWMFGSACSSEAQIGVFEGETEIGKPGSMSRTHCR